ncbi:MAG: hypothetical protein D6698_12115 [Gammaproteobacteria bacterium]|nr:MAG: hypothetical protein D6698_12115 [Gammaproteobacteria bacterium]
MREILKTLVRICQFQAGPQALPDSSALVRLFGCFYYAVSLMAAALTMPFVPAVMVAGLDLAFLFAFVYVLLLARGLTRRFPQTILAQIGTGALIMFASIPVLAWQAWVGQPGEISALLMTLLMFWNLAVMGHIFRHAISTSMFVGALLALGYLFLSLMLFEWVAGYVA